MPFVLTNAALARYVESRARRARTVLAPLAAPLCQVPSFLIVGAQRCGTTSMFKTLAQHPQVSRPALHKGLHYFDKNYEKGFNWYRGQFPFSPAGVGRASLTFESSPYYMFHPLAATRIASDMPDAKLVVLLRDPVERAYSAHSHEQARGYESEPFEAALELEPSRLAGERERMLRDATYDSVHWQHHAYITRGQYHEQILRLEGLVGREGMIVVDSHDFFVRPEESFSKVLDFLGLPPHRGIQFERHNARQRSPLPDTLRRSLEEHYAPHDERLAQWWGRTPSWRR